jgi:hypothetical protein
MNEKILFVCLILIFIFFLISKSRKLTLENFSEKCESMVYDSSCQSAPDYNPELWNTTKCLKASHNCYSYALNKIKNKLIKLCESGNKIVNPQPGHYCGCVQKIKKSTTTCKNLLDRVICDNPSIYKVDSNETKCKKGFYKAAVAVMPGETYHFYRQDKGCLWSHKDGGRDVTNLDAIGDIITDPQKSNRNFDEKKRNYTDFCGYFCVPENELMKNISRRKKGERWY